MAFSGGYGALSFTDYQLVFYSADTEWYLNRGLCVQFTSVFLQFFLVCTCAHIYSTLLLTLHHAPSLFTLQCSQVEAVVTILICFYSWLPPVHPTTNIIIVHIYLIHRFSHSIHFPHISHVSRLFTRTFMFYLISPSNFSLTMTYIRFLYYCSN